ncbi:dihydropteroate synthase [Inmirania thermothiophila]|uniref:Dihydropteroate synthase n=1 Tax=Inmirania thermothiophila TaxID=1750597 RepID=A0A3N1Y0Q6_9GAMM|nr:dihydropteroate synthase [Inmirania thermothiophila]ROR32088.1 dihydropteroate synthase [Inmirania thermothiophila]
MPGIDCGGRWLDLGRPRVMGILNVTPDSFSDGGRWADPGRACERAWQMVEEGADLVDVGGESTRPGAAPVDAEEELRRVEPVVRRLAAELPVPVSVDTSKPEVMLRCAEAGAGLINDVRALREPGALEAAAATGLPVCLMHMKGEPRTMQRDPRYDDVVAEVRGFLLARAAACEAAGMDRGRILLDPGFGFGKTLAHNLTLLRRLDRIVAAGYPVLVGISRKSMIGAILGERPVEGRLHGSVAAAVIAAWLGARIVRVHDVAATVDALAVCAALQGATEEEG